jgi:hypothetical protein
MSTPFLKFPNNIIDQQDGQKIGCLLLKELRVTVLDIASL